MLKVVGASWVQTRVSWWLLFSITVLGFIALFFGTRYRPDSDGKYAATVYYGEESKFRLEYWGQNNEPKEIKKGVARGYYEPDITKTGWATLEIETQESYADDIQACAAGMLEGALTWQNIQRHWMNTIEKTCAGRQEFCKLTRAYLQENMEHIKKLAEKMDPIDPFWHQVNLFYIQLEGIEVGFKSGMKRSRRDFTDIPSIDFLWMNVGPDLRDLERRFNGTLDFNPYRPPLSFDILKYFPEDPSNYILAHSSAGPYNSMLRIQKRYTFGYHIMGDEDSDLVNGRILTFSSYPGAIFSGDDYYQIKSITGEVLTVVGTELKNYNQTSYGFVDDDHQVLMGPRVMTANRLSRDGDDWAAIFTRKNSGTGNKQWLIIDTSDNFTVWAVEQMPGLTHAQDVTQNIIDHGYWIGCGIPYFQDILMQSDSGNYNDVTSLYNLKKTNPLYVTLHKYIHNITNIQSVIELARSYEISIIGRSDLNGISNIYGYLNILDDLHKKHHDTINKTDTEIKTDSNDRNKEIKIDLSVGIKSDIEDSLDKYATVKVNKIENKHKYATIENNINNNKHNDKVSSKVSEDVVGRDKIKNKIISSEENENVSDISENISETVVDDSNNSNNSNSEDNKTSNSDVSEDNKTSNSNVSGDNKTSSSDTNENSNKIESTDDETNSEDNLSKSIEETPIIRIHPKILLNYKTINENNLDSNHHEPSTLHYSTSTTDSSTTSPDMELENNNDDLENTNNLSYKIINKSFRGIIDVKINQGTNDFISISGPPYHKPNEANNVNVTNTTNSTTTSTTTTTAKPMIVNGPNNKTSKHIIEPFQWSNSKIKYLQHVGHPDLWNFDIFEAVWVW